MALVVVFTEQPVLAKGVATTLASAQGLDVVAFCYNLNQLVDTAGSHQPDLMLVDVTAAVTIPVLLELRRKAPAARIVLWVQTIPPELAYQTMRIGVRGILRKTVTADVLVRCLQKVASGEFWVEEVLTAEFNETQTVRLSRRQSELLRLVSQGFKNKEIAGQLGISEGSVRVYLSKLFRKVGAKDRFELALFGMKNIISEQIEFSSEYRLQDQPSPELTRRPPILIARTARAS
jgi:DNA-binding NarL/FixJ family response regulator